MITNIGGRSAARALVLAGLVTAQACASSGRVSTMRYDPPSRIPGLAAVSPERVITGEELRTASGINVLDALRQLRPALLAPPPSAAGPYTSEGLAVYMNGTYLGGVDELRAVPVSLVVDMHRLSEANARFLFGSRCVCRGGVLVVRTLH